MKRLSRFHPGAVCVYFACAMLPVMFGINPVTAGIGLAGGLVLLATQEKDGVVKTAAFHLLLPLLSAVINPVFNHNGVTALLFINGNPVTGEAILNGAVLGMVISATLLWARCFTRQMDTDRLLCVTGALHPKLSLVLSLTIRYIPMLRRQAARTGEAMRAMGLMREENAPDRLRGALRQFGAMVTWTLENGAVTADSMAARGYGSGPRSRYRRFRWTRADTALAAASLALIGLLAYARASGRIGYTWYPVYTAIRPDGAGVAGYIGYGVLCLLGSAMEIGEGLQWKKRMERFAAEERHDGLAAGE